MGLANKIAYKFATTMYTTFEQEDQLSKVKHLGAVTKVFKDANQMPESTQLEAVKEYFSRDLKPSCLLVVRQGRMCLISLLVIIQN